MIIGVSGKAGSGKDCLASYLVDKYNFIKLAFADELKIKCSIDFDLSKEQMYGELKNAVDKRYNKTPREILQITGQFYRGIYANFWVDRCIDKVLPNKNYVISDIRFPNEYKAVSAYGGKIIRLERNSIFRKSFFGQGDVSETALDNFSFDSVIYNNSSIINLYNEIDTWGVHNDLFK